MVGYFIPVSIEVAWGLYFLWALMIAGGVRYLIDETSQTRAAGTLLLAKILYVAPVITFVLFTYVFTLNKGASTAQLDSSGLWSFWFHCFVPLWLGTLASAAISCISLACPPYPPKQWKPLLIKVFTLFTIIMTFFHLAQVMPDA